MSNPVLMAVPRNERRSLLRREDNSRASGNWGDWERIDLPQGTGGGGWNKEVRAVHRNAAFAILDRPLASGVRHLAISSLSGNRPSWWEAQRIKNEIAGDAATAVEVYPPQGEVVDEADMYHLWVLPDGLTFSLSSHHQPQRASK